MRWPGRPPGRRLRHVVVDLTPLLPGGENGGARLVPLSIVPHLSVLAPDVRFTLLTTERNHDSLRTLRRRNVGRYPVSRAGMAPDVDRDGVLERARGLLRRAPRPDGPGLLAALDPDLLVCPFTAPFYVDPRIPFVSVVYDLQYVAFPEFFSTHELAIRAGAFSAASRLADRLICISDYVRGTVLENSTIPAERVTTVHLGLLQKLQPRHPATIADKLRRLGIVPDRYVLFPANFWPHKNHRTLLTAFRLYRSRQPASDMQLVFTGTPDANMELVRAEANTMGLADSVVFAGFVTDDVLAALYQACLALIFPSLYEGFGIPVLEAMAFDKPVLCANVTSLPEIAGEAALFFDPRQPAAIAAAIQQIQAEPELRATLVERGRKRLTHFGDGAQLAATYLKIFREVAEHDERRFADTLHGLYPDGWVGRRLVVGYAPSRSPRTLEVALRAPAWIPWKSVTVKLRDPLSGQREQHAVRRGQQVLLRRDLPPRGGVIELLLDPVASPVSLGVNGETRELGCECEVARLTGPDGSVDLRGLTFVSD